MKICTVTCQNADNHGARLQCFALAYWLTKKGHEVEVIDYQPDYMRGPRLWYWPKTVKDFVKLFVRFPDRLKDVRRHKVFSAFSRKYIPLTRVYSSVDDLRKNPPQADVYMAGSDQIWNPTFRNGTDPAYYLDFGPMDIRRESFAASFAVPKIEDEQKRIWIKERLKRFDRITVREQSALDILADMGIHGELQEDPVFLLSAEEWDEVLGLNNLWHELNRADERYVLIYDFFLTDEIRSVAKKYARENNCKIYAICSKRVAYANRNFVYSGPDVFVNLVKHADCVISNSFHGTVFAMIYGVPYVIVDRPDGLNVRMRDLLERKKHIGKSKALLKK